jgi:hypothetical protein
MPRTSGNIVRARNNMRAHTHYSRCIYLQRVFQWQQSSRSGERAREDDVRQSALAAWPHLRIYVSASLVKKRALKSSAIGNLWLLWRPGIEINTYVRLPRATIKAPQFCEHQSLLYLHIIAQIFTLHPQKCRKSNRYCKRKVGAQRDYRNRKEST